MTEQGEKTGFYFSGKTHFWSIVILIVVVFGLIVDTIKADNDYFYADFARLNKVTESIHHKYVEEINSEDLVDNAIKGMLEILDPHTSFFKKKEYEELRIHTEGKFGGLGIQISIRDKVLTVVTPISGTPASRSGIQSGDQIVKINGTSTKGIEIDQAVEKLRGDPGSEVSITIMRKGEAKPLEFTITREIITIKAVPFNGVLDNDIGYIKLVTFSQEASDEVEKAIESLVKKDIEGLILDLRRNPGGLLPQAIKVSEKFLNRKSLVVSTRGRLRGQNKEFFSYLNPVLPKDMPLIVLVNAASASASEIVAGAIQDYDRGVILGDTTFGKGSVQSIFALDRNHHLKLTTAFYYTPSGRCINKPINDIPDNEVGDKPVGDKNQESKDSLAAADSVADSVSALIEYKTKGGRIVYGGGGVIPDTIVEPPVLKPLVRALFIKDIYFKFTNLEYPKLQRENVVFDSSFAIDKRIMDDFYAFLDSIDFNYESHTKSKFNEFKEWAGLSEDTASDSTANGPNIIKPEWSPKELELLTKVTKQVEDILVNKDRSEYENCEDDIKKYMRESFLGRGLGQDNSLVYRTILARDNQVLAAVNILSDKRAYKKLLQAKNN